MMRESNTAERLWEEKESEALGTVATDVQVKFDAPAILRKWPSLKNGSAPLVSVYSAAIDRLLREIHRVSIRHRFHSIEGRLHCRWNGCL
jgi:hypothetical protein